ncbi:hypothetical protein AOQ84DRAFT_130399 [Glonium stellatum]|uniref:Uncharacterized protein n=1 Tax=Glonium stellatum TaxID=574774 RepID=A0A8E2FAN9_9PEZI|nr:hypothetical protein AOQ84DRAFT_130399 [Glonium stellatum]
MHTGLVVFGVLACRERLASNTDLLQKLQSKSLRVKEDMSASISTSTPDIAWPWLLHASWTDLRPAFSPQPLT